MAEYTPTYYSAELDGPFPSSSGTHEPLKPNQSGGSTRKAYFQYTTTGDENDEETIALAFVPAGARFVGGHIAHGALATMDQVIVGLFGANGDGTINSSGQVDDPNKFLTADNMDAAGTVALCDTVAHGLGSTIDKDCFVVLTFGDAGTGDTDSIEDIRGYIEYTLD